MQSSFLQTKQWAEFKKMQGWHPREVGDIFVLERKLPFGKSLLYAPEVIIDNPQTIAQIAQNAQAAGSTKNAIFLRIELLNGLSPDIIAALEKNRFRKSFEEMQPEYRQIIDLSKSLDQILAQMKPKGRYNINIAKREGVRVATGDVKTFYKLYTQAASRDKFSARSEKYFQNLIDHFPEQSEIFIAYHQNLPIAGALIIFWKGVASYLYGGSANESRNVMAPYLLHWHIMQEAKHRNMKHYDLLAIAPSDEPHKFSGLRRFKQQFGGRQVDITGSWDLVYKPVWYIIYKVAEKLRRH